jgi:amino acid transporter
MPTSTHIPTDLTPRTEHSWVRRLLLGTPLDTDEAVHQTIPKTVGLAVFASDALSSVAYATQEILFVLALAGTAAFHLSLPIAGAICVLLIILTISYRQTIHAYPSGGGAYIVSRDNLGERPAQIAGAALLTDYILTVAVSISSGAEQIASAFPALHAYRVAICLVMIGIMTLVNLRGVKESGTIFAGPTYFFVAMTLILIGVGAWRWATGSLGVVSGLQAEMAAVQPLTIFLILRAFSSGCTALTGVEAISNGIPAFRAPKSRNAAMTLTVMSGVLMTMFVGITLLAYQVHALPTEHETIISQLARTVLGSGSGYLLMIAATTVILIMAANTSYADFPRLAALQAGDGFLPRQLTIRGQRLVYSWGIVTLALFASLLIVIFDATTTRLIPLYAIGVFLSFTLSQAGMVVRWRRIARLKPGEVLQTTSSTLMADRHWLPKLVVNAVGCVLTAVVMAVFAVTKFGQGAWVVLVIIPALVSLFFAIHRHYQNVAQALSLSTYPAARTPFTNTVVVLVGTVHRGTIEAATYARSIAATDVRAVHISTDAAQTAKVKAKWEAWMPDMPLVIVESPYRRTIKRITHYVCTVAKETQADRVTIVIPEFITARWWHHLLHNQTALLIKRAFLFDRKAIVVDVPYHLDD